jgi:hypothetical protein
VRETPITIKKITSGLSRVGEQTKETVATKNPIEENIERKPEFNISESGYGLMVKKMVITNNAQFRAILELLRSSKLREVTMAERLATMSVSAIT